MRNATRIRDQSVISAGVALLISASSGVFFERSAASGDRTTGATHVSKISATDGECLSPADQHAARLLPASPAAPSSRRWWSLKRNDEWRGASPTRGAVCPRPATAAKQLWRPVFCALIALIPAGVPVRSRSRRPPPDRYRNNPSVIFASVRDSATIPDSHSVSSDSSWSGLPLGTIAAFVGMHGPLI
uniref:Secreted protein n=1 Tax=Steinernema glaseri TaxID=37863 RepID=A0A1I7Y7E0_9BILA